MKFWRCGGAAAAGRRRICYFGRFFNRARPILDDDTPLLAE
jgi:hypothetical protein